MLIKSSYLMLKRITIIIINITIIIIAVTRHDDTYGIEYMIDMEQSNSNRIMIISMIMMMSIAMMVIYNDDCDDSYDDEHIVKI
jgi:hypothetical protein